MLLATLVCRERGGCFFVDFRVIVLSVFALTIILMITRAMNNLRLYGDILNHLAFYADCFTSGTEPRLRVVMERIIPEAIKLYILN